MQVGSAKRPEGWMSHRCLVKWLAVGVELLFVLAFQLVVEEAVEVASEEQQSVDQAQTRRQWD